MKPLFGDMITKARKSNGLTLVQLSALCGIDAAVISKIENGKRVATLSQFDDLSDVLNLNTSKAKVNWLTDKILTQLDYDDSALEALQLAEEKIRYSAASRTSIKGTYSDTLSRKLKTITDLKEKWSGLKPLDALQLQKMREYISVKYTYHSNKIEGNTLTIQETQLVVGEGITIAGKSVREHLEAVNHTEAIKYLYDVIADKIAISEKTIKSIHYLVLKSINSDYAGKYRDVPVRITGSEHVPCQPYMIRKHMEELMQFYNDNYKIMHPVIMAAEMHERLVSIHPFLDGNGRTSRLLMNLILLKDGYTIANIKGDNHNRMQYYQALESCRVSNKDAFYRLVLDAAIESLEEHLEMV